MVPFAGRVCHGRFTFDGVEHRLPVNLPPHAIHGYGFVGEWTQSGPDTIEWRLPDPWPFPGLVEQTFQLGETSAELTMTLHAEARQPWSMGWHPWFKREIGATAPAQLEFDVAQMYQLDSELIPTGRLVEPPPGPWDNCFVGMRTGPTLRWGAELAITVTSDADHWVVFDELDHALCVEPQTGPPDVLNHDPPVLEAGGSAKVAMTITWR